MSDGTLNAVVALCTLCVTLWTNRKVERVHKATNSLTDRLVALTRLEAHAAGVKEEREREARD